jgi:hypothetical protein
VTTAGGGGGSTGDPNINAVVTAVASYGLAGSRLPWPAAPLGDEAWHAVLAACVSNHVVGLLGAATSRGVLALDRRHRGGFEAVMAEWRDRSARLELDALELSARFDRAGVGHLVVDGPATAHRAYRPAGQRLYASTEILVANAAAARDELDDLASGRRLRCVTDLMDGAAPVAVGLADLADRPDEAAASVAISGHRLPTLPIDAHLVASCVALRHRRPSLPLLRDIAQLALADGATVDGVTAWASQWRVTDQVAEGIRQAWTTLDLADKIGLSTWAFRHGTMNGHPSDGQGAAPPRRLGPVTSVAHRLARVLTPKRAVQ